MTKISRRAVLRGTGGAALALPLLQAMGAQGATPPKRLLIMAVGNGTAPEHFWPTAPGATPYPLDMPLKGGAYSTGFTALETVDYTPSPILEPLADVRKQVLVLEGLENCKGTGGHRMYGALLTGFEPRSGSDNSLSARGTSVDQVLAARVGVQTKFPSLQFGVNNGDQHNLYGLLSWYGDAKQAPSENNPYAMFSRLMFGGSGDARAADLVRLERKSVLDFAVERIRTLEGRVGADDRAKLGNYLEGLRAVEKQLSHETAVPQGCAKPALAQALDWKTNRSTPLVAAAQIDMAVAALACDLTRVITLQVGHEGSGMSHPWVGVAGGHHYDLGHSSDKDLARVSDIIKVGQWHAGLFASLITKLGAISEAGGTLLDSTLLVWVNGMTKGNQHSNANHPTVLAGRFGGSIKTGRYLRMQRTGPKYQYPLPTGKSYGDLWWEVLRAAGIEQPSFGDPRYFHGGIPELRA